MVQSYFVLLHRWVQGTLHSMISLTPLSKKMADQKIAVTPFLIMSSSWKLKEPKHLRGKHVISGAFAVWVGADKIFYYKFCKVIHYS